MAPSPSSEFQCPVCGVVLADARELEEHREVHFEQRAVGESVHPLHACAFCGAKFRTPEELRDHNRTAHQK
ncbi:MAG: hypothetical protein L3K18_03155 [Thermoplasmata archaeon]|nr:hypothetical protein [Thermoplasmata archaeon]MCI4356130.1 hypothetical protein [Thermoplasmata archaeon]